MTLTQLKKRDRDLLFWSVHAMGWTAYGISQYLGALLYGKPVAYTKVIIVAALAGFLLTAPLRYLCRWLWNRPPALTISVALVSAYLVALIWRAPVNWAYDSGSFVFPYEL